MDAPTGEQKDKAIILLKLMRSWVIVTHANAHFGSTLASLEMHGKNTLALTGMSTELLKECTEEAANCIRKSLEHLVRNQGMLPGHPNACGKVGFGPAQYSDYVQNVVPTVFRESVAHQTAQCKRVHLNVDATCKLLLLQMQANFKGFHMNFFRELQKADGLLVKTISVGETMLDMCAVLERNKEHLDALNDDQREVLCEVKESVVASDGIPSIQQHVRALELWTGPHVMGLFMELQFWGILFSMGISEVQMLGVLEDYTSAGRVRVDFNEDGSFFISTSICPSTGSDNNAETSESTSPDDAEHCSFAEHSSVEGCRIGDASATRARSEDD